MSDREEAKFNNNEDLTKLISLTEAASLCLYSQEYLSLLARRGLIGAIKLGRNWVISKEVLFAYVAKNTEVKSKRDGTYREQAFKAVAKKTGLVLKSPKAVAEKDFWLTTDVSVLAKLAAGKLAAVAQKLNRQILNGCQNGLLALGRVENGFIDWWRLADKRRLTVATILLLAGGLQVYLAPAALAGLRADQNLALKFFKSTAVRSVLAARNSFENTLNLPADIKYAAENIGKVKFRRLALTTANTSISGLMILGTETAKSFDQFYRQTLNNTFGFIDKKDLLAVADSIAETRHWRVSAIKFGFNSGAETLYQTVQSAIKPFIAKQAKQLLAVKPVVQKQLLVLRTDVQEKLCYLPFNNQVCAKIAPMVAGVTEEALEGSFNDEPVAKTTTATGSKILVSVGGSISNDWQTIKESTALMSQAASRAPDYLFQATKDLSSQKAAVSWLFSRLGKGLSDFYDLSFGAFNNQLEKVANLSGVVYQTIKNNGIPPVVREAVIVKQPLAVLKVNSGSDLAAGPADSAIIKTVEKVVYVTGPAGPQGEQGEQGPVGPQGPAGTNGFVSNPVSLITPPDYNYKTAPIYNGNNSLLDNLSVINYLTVGKGGVGTGGPLNVAGSASFAAGTNNVFTVASPAAFSNSLTSSGGLNVTGSLTAGSVVTLDDDLYVAGNVGIGTTTPAFKLDVNGIVNATALYVDGNPYIGSQWTTNGNDIYYTVGNLGIGTTTPVAILAVSTTTQSSLPLLTVASTTNETLFTVAANGNVGVGIVIPAYQLDVVGAGHFTSYLDAANFVATSTTATSTFAGGVVAGVNQFVVQQTTGNVGIGTATPASILDIYGTDAVHLPVGTTIERPLMALTGQVRYNLTTHQFEGYGDNNVWQGLGGVINAAQTTYITAGDDDYLRFVTAAGERLVINDTGNVGIGTTTASAQLAASSTDKVTAIFDQQGNSDILQLQKAGATVAKVTSDGLVGVGTSTPLAWLSVSSLNQSSLPLLTVASTTNATLFTVLAKGNVGIGTTVPSYSLEINATDAIKLPVGNTAARPTAVSGLIRFNSETNTFEGYNNSAWSGLGGLIDLNQDTYILPESAPGANEDALTFFTSGAQAMIIDNSGKVGIGTDTPHAILAISTTTSAVTPFLTVADDTNQNLFTVLANGNVGIKQATPSYVFDVTGEGHFTSYLDAANFVATSTTATSTFAGGVVAGVNQFVVQQATGRVGIGVLAPTAKLELAAGSTAAGTAPLKFASGDLLTAPEVGAIEFNNDKWYGTITTGAVRKEFAFTEDVVAKNDAIVGATKTKITYDAKGLITGGADATTADIADSADTNKRYVTNADLVNIGNLSGINTGDQTITLTGDVTGSGSGSFATAIGANKVTLAMQATLPANTIIGNDTAGVLTPKALTAAEVRALLNTDGLYLGISAKAADADLLDGHDTSYFQTALVNSAGLAGALSDETGTGYAVFSDSPVFTTQITAPAIVSASTLSITSNTSNALTLDSGSTGAINIGTNANAKTITIGNVTGATAVNINTGTGGSAITTTNGIFSLLTGTGAINVGTDAAAKTITIGNGTGATSLVLNAGTGNINIGNNAFARTINLGTGAAVVQTINIGGTGANVIAIGNTQTGGSIAMGAAMTTGAITIGGTGLQTGTIGIGTGTGAQTINIGTGSGVKDLRVVTGNTFSTLTIGNSSWFRAVDSTGVGADNILKVNTSDEIEFGNTLSLNGYLTAPEDFGAIYLFNAPVSATPAAGTAESVSLGIDYNSILTVYSEADNAGGVQNMRVGVGTITPQANLTVVATAGQTGNILTVASSTNVSLFTIGNHGEATFASSVWSAAAFQIQDRDGAAIFNIDNLTTSTLRTLNLGTNNGATATATGVQIGYGGLCVDNDGTCNASTTGRISGVALVAENSDVAENYSSLEKLEAGDLVMADPNNDGYIVKTTGSYNNNVIGVISENPGLLMGSNIQGYPVALVGRIPTKVTTANGPIKAGDTLTIAPIPGYAMKLQDGQAGLIIGTALADFDGSAGEAGKISMFVNPDYKTTFAESSFGQITDGQIATNAAISDAKLATITSAGKIAASALPQGIALLQGDTQNFLGNYIFGRADNSWELLVFNSRLASNLNFASGNQFKIGSREASAANIYSAEMNASRLMISEDLLGLQDVGQQKYGLYVSASSGLAYFGANVVVGQLADFDNVLPQDPDFKLNGGDLAVVDDLGVGGGLFVAGNLRVAGMAEFTQEGAAQLFSANGEILAGEIAVADSENVGQVSRSVNANARNILGVAATSAAQIFGSRSGLTNPQPIIISGLAKVKASAINGAIKAGDKLTTADTAGIAMLATRPGAGVLGFAMENLSEGEGEIKVFIEPGVYFQPLARIITVGESGADFTTITKALNSITDNAPNLPYIIKVAPGVYHEQLVLKDYVAVVGEDQSAVVIENEVSPLVTATVNTRLENVSLRLSGSESEPLLLSLSGAGASGTATILRDISLKSETTAPATGISLISSGANVNLSRLSFAGNFSQGIGMFGAGQEVILNDSEISNVTGKAVIVASGQLRSSFNKFSGTLGDIYIGLGARVESRADDYKNVENLGLFLDTTNRDKIDNSYIDFGWLATAVSSSPLMVDISAGSGYINGVKVSASAANALAILPNSINYLFMNDEGNISVATTTAEVGKNVLIAQVEADASNIVKIVNDRKNEIVVAKEGGQFLTINDAINSIMTASAGNRWTINVRPGVYVESVIMKPFIDIVGSGDATVLTAQNQTVVTADFVPTATSTIITTGATTTPALMADLKNLKVIMTGDVVGQAVIEAKSANLNLENVKLEWSGLEDHSAMETKGSGISISGESKVNLNKVDISGSAVGVLTKAILAKFATTTVDIAYSRINSTENDVKTVCFQDLAEVDCPEPVEGEAPFNSGITVYSAYNILKGSGYNFWTSRGAVISSSHDTYVNYGGDGRFVQNDYFRNLADPQAVVFNLQNAGLDLFTVTASGTVAISPQNVTGDSVIINSVTSGSALTVINTNSAGVALTVQGNISAGGGTVAIGTVGDTIDLGVEGVNYKFKENVRRNTLSAYSKTPATGDQMWGSSDNAWSPAEGITIRSLKVQYNCSDEGYLEIVLRAKDGTEIAHLNSNSCGGWGNVIADNLDYHLTSEDGLYAEFVNATAGLTNVTVSVDFVYDNN